jgi:ribosomal subunit interface protein
MNTQFTARHFHASEGLKNRAIEKINDLTKYYENIISARIVLNAEDKLRRVAEIILTTKRKNITGRGNGERMGVAIDDAFSKVESQLKKLKQKKKHRKGKALKASVAEYLQTPGETLE